jgi:hypothetical protein
MSERTRRGRLARASLSAAIALATALASASVGAQTTPAAPPTAEQLFQDARALVEKGDYAGACPLLAQSQKLDPAVGTQFNLADCYEHVGKTATAYATFNDVARIARAAGKFERERSAKERASALEPKLARVHLDVKAAAPGLEVHIDDAVLDKAAWAAPFPLDPGEHRITAAAPSHRPWEGSVSARASELAEVTVPELVDTTVRVAPLPVVVAPPPPSTQRTIALVTAGVGVAGLIVGGISGIVAISSRSTGERECPSEVYSFRCPTEQGTSAWNTATTAGNVSTIAFIAGGVLVAGAAVLWFTAPSSRTRVGASGSGLRVEGSF